MGIIIITSLSAIVRIKDRIYVNHLGKHLAETGARDSGQEGFLEEGALELARKTEQDLKRETMS